MQDFIYKMINKYGFTSEQAIKMYETLKKVSESSNLTVKEAVEFARK